MTKFQPELRRGNGAGWWSRLPACHIRQTMLEKSPFVSRRQWTGKRPVPLPTPNASFGVRFRVGPTWIPEIIRERVRDNMACKKSIPLDNQTMSTPDTNANACDKAREAISTAAVMRHARRWGMALLAAFSLPLAAGASPAFTGAPSAPTNLRVDDVTEPVGTEAVPYFGWLDNDTNANEIQTGYEILVATSAVEPRCQSRRRVGQRGGFERLGKPCRVCGHAAHCGHEVFLEGPHLEPGGQRRPIFDQQPPSRSACSPTPTGAGRHGSSATPASPTITPTIASPPTCPPGRWRARRFM